MWFEEMLRKKMGGDVEDKNVVGGIVKVETVEERNLKQVDGRRIS